MNAREQDYCRAVREAHYQAARKNPNASSEIVRAYARLGVPFLQAMAGALASLDGAHGPVTAARHVVFYATDPEIDQALAAGLRLAGFGNSFYRDQIDPAWEEPARLLTTHWPSMRARLDTIAGRIRDARGREAHPNAAAFSAIACHFQGVAEGAELSIFVAARAGAWAEIWAEEAGGIGLYKSA